jgi:hypothetical protein
MYLRGPANQKGVMELSQADTRHCGSHLLLFEDPGEEKYLIGV